MLGAVDTELTVKGDGESFVVKPTKQRDLECDWEHHYRLEAISLGPDENGTEMTSCVVAPISSPLRSAGRKLPPSAQGVYSCFEQLLEATGETVPEEVIQEKYGSSSAKRKGIKGVKVSLVRDRFVKSEQEDPDTPDTKADSSKRKFSRGIEKLQEAELIEKFGGYMWKFIRA